MKYLSPFETYKIYTALKLHFKSDYDAIKYNYKTTVTLKSFDRRKDKYYFAKIGKDRQSEERVISYIVSNFVDDPTRWVGSFSKDCHRKRASRLDALEYIFEKDCARLRPILESLLSDDQSFPRVIELLHQGEISIETVSILNRFTRFVERVKVPENLWEDTRRRIVKYEPFLRYDRKKLGEIVKSSLQS